VGPIRIAMHPSVHGFAWRLQREAIDLLAFGIPHL
jgi:hypothetical protein